MRRVIVRYKTKEPMGDANQALIEAVFADLAATDPGGLRYASFRADDGVNFTHIAIIEGDENPLGQSEAFQRFQADIGARCEIPPSAEDVTLVGSYRFFD